MIILIDNKIIDKTGTLFVLEAVSPFARVRAVEADSVIDCKDTQEAQACLHDLAQRLYAHKWSSTAHCFVPVACENKTVGRVIEYMSQDTYPARCVDDVLYIVSLMSLCEESHEDVRDFLKMVRAKDYFDEGNGPERAIEGEPS